MVIRLLGPVELRTADGETAELAGAQRRAVLALLALRSERVVPIERFFELLWGDEPPARARAALQGHVAALRKVLTGSPFELRTRAPGYLLTGATELIDVRRFEALAATAVEESDDAAAVALLEQALGLWSGAALADLPDTELRRALVDQLDAARTTVLTAWAERRLRLGSAAVAVPALEQSVRANGLREPVVALLMRALQQAGRLSDALAVYHHARERLAAELGVVPGRSCRRRWPRCSEAVRPKAGCPRSAVGRTRNRMFRLRPATVRQRPRSRSPYCRASCPASRPGSWGAAPSPSGWTASAAPSAPATAWPWWSVRPGPERVPP